ncbi:MAG: DUF2179 domain-containing protein [Deferribacteres bacterium]|nr:DUF2179 domain-containing protein [candidate division KSB1 bacterium]MCB9503950.1 DUF2179 domain-containing protein [Deferribacteres bacterium]
MIENSDLFNWVLLPVGIYLARVTDVSLGTMRIITLSRGLKKIAPILGFIEILIWLMAIRQIFNNLNNPACYLAYAAGFASGIFTGMWIEERVAIGLRVVRIITRFDAEELIKALRESGFGITVIDGEGSTGSVKIIFTVVRRKDVATVTAMSKKFNPKSFISVEDVRQASEAISPFNGSHSIFSTANLLKFEKKGN